MQDDLFVWWRVEECYACCRAYAGITHLDEIVPSFRLVVRHVLSDGTMILEEVS